MLNGMQPTSELPKELTVWDGMALTLGIILGAGIFALTGRVAQYAHSFTETILWWILAGFLSLLGAMIYAELACRLPRTGGEYVYLREAFGPAPAFLYGWAQLLVIRTNPGASLALVFAEYTDRVIPLGPTGRIAVAAALLWTLGFVNYFGVRSGKKVQWATTTVKVVGLMLVIGAGLLYHGDMTHLADKHAPVGSSWVENFSSAMLLVFFTYLGWDRLGNVAGEMKQPEKDIPKVLIVSVCFVTTLYLLLSYAVHSAIPIDVLSRSKTPASDVAQLFLGNGGTLALVLIATTATSSSINATILSSARIYYSMAMDGLLFKPFARIHPRWRSPHVAVLAHVAWASCLLLLYGNLETLIASQVFTMLIWYGVMAIGFLRIRNRGGESRYQVPFYPWLVYVFLAGLLLLAVATIVARPMAALYNVCLIFSGLPFYYWMTRQSRRAVSLK